MQAYLIELIYNVENYYSQAHKTEREIFSPFHDFLSFVTTNFT